LHAPANEQGAHGVSYNFCDKQPKMFRFLTGKAFLAIPEVSSKRRMAGRDFQDILAPSVPLIPEVDVLELY
jgi:hypothetical protein